MKWAPLTFCAFVATLAASSFGAASDRHVLRVTVTRSYVAGARRGSGQIGTSELVQRDGFGVPVVVGSSERDAWVRCGYAVAQDRMWQMELSRRAARGRLAEILGSEGFNSDAEVVRTGYTDLELKAQFDGLSDHARMVLDAYARGVNRFLGEHLLPPQYGGYALKPEPWSALDSVAIGIRLFQQFGKGGAGALRNLAFLDYLKTRPQLAGRALDVLDDFAWANDPAAITTVDPRDDTLAAHPPSIFFPTSRATTAQRLAEIPIPSLFELFPAIRLAERSDSRELAESLALPFRTGSYCVVVGPNRSSSGSPLLLSAPQMGFTSPSILHEISISCPSFSVCGADVPGLPGVVIGTTPHFAWGLTSGVADTEDTVWSHADGAHYWHDGRPKPFAVRSRVVRVRGEPDRIVSGNWTESGPVVLQSASRGVAFSRHDAYRGLEMKSFEALISLYPLRKASDIERAMRGASMSFNFFYATDSGDIGYRYLGLVPLRAPGLDPRLPTPDESRYRWRGFVPYEKMPHVRNPGSGLLVNWNNKPAAWWPNGDTPVWGRIHEVSLLRDELRKRRISEADLKGTARAIAQKDPTWEFLGKGLFDREYKSGSAAFGGDLLEGSIAAGAYESWIRSLRRALFEPSAGTLLSPALFETAIQPTLMWNAVHGRTQFDYLGGRTPFELARVAVPDKPEPWRAPAIPVPGAPPIVYSNRGTFTQIVELGPGLPRGRSVLVGGESESGPHSADQVALARHWAYKPMRVLKPRWQ